MARGSIVKRCPVCKTNRAGATECRHKEAVYSVVYRVCKKQYWETVGPNKKDAERKLAGVIAQINSGGYVKPTDIIFKDFSGKWLEAYARVSVKPSTFRTYENTIHHHLIPAFGDSELKQILPERIQSYVSELRKQRSPKTVNNVIILLRTMFKYARRWKYVREDPMQDIDNMPLQHREMAYLNVAEINLLLKHAHEPFKTLLLTAIMTGMRRGELLALQWGDLDWHSSRIFVHRGLDWSSRNEAGEGKQRWQFVSPKSKRSERTIEMSPALREALQIHKISAPVSQHDLVFCNNNGNPLDPDNLVKREFHPLLVTAGLRKIRFHDLRHTYTSLLIAQNENIKFIQSQLGHASIQTTLDRYGHLLPNTQGEVGQRIDKQIFSVPAEGFSYQSAANTVLTK